MAGEDISEAISVDREALTQIATELQKSAEVVGSAGLDVARNEFGGPDAGAHYVAQGNDVCDGMSNIVAWLTNWQAATNSTAQFLGGGSVAYTAADASTAQMLHNIDPAVPR